MADKVTVISPEGQERLVFDKPAVIERYKGLGWKVSKAKATKKTVAPKTKKDGSPILHPRDLEEI